MKDQNQEIDYRKVLIEWETLEFIPFERGRTWYLAASGVLLLFLTYAAFSRSLTMALAFIMIAVVFLLTEHRKPRTIQASVTNMGVEYDDQYYPFNKLNAFWMVYHPPYVRTLYLRIKKDKHYELLKIQLNDMNPVALRDVLIKEIPEIEGADEPMIDIFSRLLRLQ